MVLMKKHRKSWLDGRSSRINEATEGSIALTRHNPLINEVVS